MVAATEANEPATQCYEWFISDDSKTCHIYERYADSAAAMTHLSSFLEKFADRLLACVEPSRMIVYGDPSEEVKETLAAFGALHMGADWRFRPLNPFQL